MTTGVAREGWWTRTAPVGTGSRIGYENWLSSGAPPEPCAPKGGIPENWQKLLGLHSCDGCYELLAV
jgi:hypothetical protein